MEIAYRDPLLERLYFEAGFTGGYSPTVVSAYRGRLQLISAAPAEEAMRPLRSLCMQPYAAGNGQHAMRVTDDWQLIVAFEDGKDGRVAVVEAMIERSSAATEKSS